MDNLFAYEVATKELMNLMMKDDQKVCCDGTIFTAIKAIAFRKPKRPVELPSGYLCSNCNNRVLTEENFCSNCGLAISWDEN